MGAPLQKLVKALNKDVGEEGGLLTSSKSLCPPFKINRFDIFRILVKKSCFFRGINFFKILMIFSGGKIGYFDPIRWQFP